MPAIPDYEDAQGWQEFSTDPSRQTEPPSSVAVTWSAALLAKKEGVTEEALHAVISRCEGILY